MTRYFRHAVLSATALTSCLLAGPVSAGETLDPIDQSALNAMLSAEGPEATFEFAFEAGDELTEFSFTSTRGVGANVGEGRRFARFPRADLSGSREWATHTPMREGGPNATACIACHNAPFANGAGDIALNVAVDPAHTGDPKRFLERNTLHLFALAASQKLAEEISMDLYRQRDAVADAACNSGSASAPLAAKGVDYGTISATRTATAPCSVSFDMSRVEGIDDDLVVRAFGWKGNHSTIRAFTRGAAHNELGLQAVELVGHQDGDHDGVIDELSVGDLTALSIYMAALERPVTQLELSDLGLLDLSPEEIAAIKTGEEAFASAGCASCHVPEMHLADPVFREPSTTPGFGEDQLPSGAKASAFGLSAATAVSFDMTADQPNNRIELANGQTVHLGAFPKSADGGARIAWFTDFKRHDMGAELADPDDPLGIGARMWPTRSLAGVGSTAPWLHDGRATTLDEAIRAHGGDAAESRDAYLDLAENDRAALVAFLENLVIFKQETVEEEEH